MSRKTREVQEQVAENRNQTRKLDSQFILVSTQNDRSLTFTRNFIEVEVELVVYDRDLSTSLISGHPNEKHGSGRGQSGDLRTEWEVRSVTVDSELLVRDGRSSVRDSLAGETGSVRYMGIGKGSSSVETSNIALEDETERVLVAGVRDSFDTTRARSMPYLFSFHGNEAQEFGVFDGDGRMVTRSALVDVESISDEKEIRADKKLTFSGSGVGDSVVTDDGIEAIADSMSDPFTVVGLAQLSFGIGESQPAESDSVLDEEIISISAGGDLDPEKITLRSTLFESEPSQQPVDLTEIGVKDNQDRLVWRTLIQSFEKTEQFEVSTSVGFNVRSA